MKLSLLLAILLYSSALYAQNEVSSIELTYPNGGETILSGEDLKIQWQGVLPTNTVKIEFSTDNGKTWKILTDNATGLQYIWEKVPNLKSKQCLIRISSGNIKVPTLEWQKTYGGSKDDAATSICMTRDGNYLIGGRSFSKDGDLSNNKGSSDFFVMKINSLGTILWQINLGGQNLEYLESMTELIDGRIIAVGYATSKDGDLNENKGIRDYWIVELSEKGEFSSQRTVGGKESDYAFSVSATAEGGYIVIGKTDSQNGDIGQSKGGTDGWAVKFSKTGELLWEKSYGGTNRDVAESIQTTKDGGYVFAGYTNSSDGDVTTNYGYNDAWIVKTNVDGDIEWQKTYGGTLDDELNDIQQTSDGGYITVGFSKSSDRIVKTNRGGEDIWVIKLDDEGVIEWQKTIGGTKREIAYSVRETYDNGYIVVGFSESDDIDAKINRGNKDFWVIKLNRKGDMEWQKSFGGLYDDFPHSVVESKDHGFVVVGSTLSYDRDVSSNKGGEDFWVIKLSSDNSILSTDISNNVFTSSSSLIIKDTNYDWGIAKVGQYVSKDCNDFIMNISSIPRTIDSVYFVGMSADYLQAKTLNTKVIQSNGTSDVAISFKPLYKGGHFANIVFVSGVDTVTGVVFAYAIDDATSVEDGKELFSSSNDGLMLYPNPSSEYTNIYFTQHESTPATFEIVNLSGEVMFTYIEESSESIKKGNIKLDISSLPNGIYSVRYKMLNSIYSSRLSVIH